MKIESATSGTGLLATFNGTRRVWLDLFDKVSPDEHAMAHTTPRTAETRRRRIHYLEPLLNTVDAERMRTDAQDAEELYLVGSPNGR